HPDEQGTKALKTLIEKIKKDAAGKKYDCLIGLSGGVDSSYLMYMAKAKWGLNPLAFTVDTGWNLPVAEENVRKIVDTLQLDVHNEKIDHVEMMDTQLAYFKSQVPYQDNLQDHTIFASLYNFAAQNGFKYILTGGNYSTECVREPNEWVHCNDLKQIKDIQKKYGTVKLNKLQTCSMFKYKLYYRYLKGVQNIKVLDYIPYIKKDVIKELKDVFDWEPYKNKHYESIFTRFYEGYWLIKKFGYDKRKAHFSSLILTGQLKREEALEIIANDPYPDEDAMPDMAFIAEQLGITTDEFMHLMDEPNKTYKDYKSSKKLIDLAVKLAQLVGMEKRNFR
ncbi:MAG: N-acetyl sugar amidotransferase, partial [Eubacterium sp.]